MRRNTLRAIPLFLLTLALMQAQAFAADPLKDAKKRLSDAQSELTKAKVGVSLAAKKIQQQLEATPEWKQAAIAANGANIRYEAAAKTARQKLEQEPRYKAAAAEYDKRVAERDALRANPPRQSADDLPKSAGQKDSAPDPIIQASVAVLNAQSALRKLQQDTLAADPKVVQAKADLDDANAMLADLKRSALEKVKDDPTFESARQRLQQASANYEQAAKDLNDARKQQAAAEDQKLDRDLDTQRQQMFDRAGFRR